MTGILVRILNLILIVALCFVATSPVCFAAKKTQDSGVKSKPITSTQDKFAIRQAYQSGEVSLLGRGKLTRLSSIYGLARYQYLKEWRSKKCVRFQQCPKAYLELVNNYVVTKIVSPTKDAYLVSLYSQDGQTSLGRFVTPAAKLAQVKVLQ